MSRVLIKKEHDGARSKYYYSLCEPFRGHYNIVVSSIYAHDYKKYETMIFPTDKQGRIVNLSGKPFGMFEDATELYVKRYNNSGSQQKDIESIIDEMIEKYNSPEEVIRREITGIAVKSLSDAFNEATKDMGYVDFITGERFDWDGNKR